MGDTNRWNRAGRGHRNARAAGMAVLLCLCAAASAQERKDTTKPEQEKVDLSKRLIREAAGDGTGDVMSEILRLMGETAKLLEVNFDPGQETQARQARILEQLDKAIKQAALSRKKTPRGSQQSKGDPRKRQPEPADAKDKGANKQSSAADGKQGATPPGDEQLGAAGAAGRLRESRRTWGNLPERDRDEVIQGSSESYLERYRAWIEQYYRALQESDQ